MRQLKISVAVLAITTLASCNGNVDPIHGTTPVDTTFWNGISQDAYFPLSKFHEMGESNDTAGQRTMVDKYRKILTANVIAHYPQIKDEKSIRFVLGSGYAKDVKSGNGSTYSGTFKNELIIVLNDSLVKETLFLACGNSTVSPLEIWTETDFETAEQWRFTIQKGEGLATYLPKLKEWRNIASNLPIKDKNGNIVGNFHFFNYLGKNKSLLFEGDVIDLIAGKVYDQTGQEVDFERRKFETRIANRANAEAKAKRNRTI